MSGGYSPIQGYGPHSVTAAPFLTCVCVEGFAEIVENLGKRRGDSAEAKVLGSQTLRKLYTLKLSNKQTSGSINCI